MPVRVRYLERGEYPLAARFLTEHWRSGNNVYARLPELFEWTFGGRAMWDAAGYSFALAEDDTGVVGILGAVPFVFNLRGRTSPGLWLVNWLTLPDHRRGGVALQLLKAFWRVPFDTLIAFGMNELVTPLYRGIGWHLPPDIPRHILVLPTAIDRMAALLRLTHPDWTTERVTSLASAFSAEGDRGAEATRGRDVPSGWDAYGWSRLASGMIGAARDADYLRWRYAEHPAFEYRFISATEWDRMGLLVWRLETIRRATAAGLEEVDRIGRLVEFLPASRRNAAVLLSAVREDLLAADAMGIDFYGYHGTLGGWLSELGVRRTDVHPDGDALPSRFQPLEARGGRIRSALLARGAPSPDTSSACAWYWSKSDSDQDRPN